jgi:squalene-hopene/tetraprenyl-beta-curcumene cyclase
MHCNECLQGGFMGSKRLMSLVTTVPFCRLATCWLAIGIPCLVYLAIATNVPGSSTVCGEEVDAVLSIDNVTPPPPNVPDEPVAETFSLEKAVRFLDQAALDWTRSRGCFACHTNYLYLLARPMVDADVLAHRQVRQALEAMVEQRWPEQGPRWDAEVVMTAAVLALNDRLTMGTLHPTTRKALDRLWTVQRDDGGVSWLKCNWPPMESDDDFGVCMMLLGALAAPGDYARTEPAQSGIQKIRTYLENHPPPTLHHRAMLLWASGYSSEVLSAPERDAIVEQLFAAQHPAGGWNLAALGNWQRSDGSAQDTSAPDGYGTGFVLYVLRQAGVPKDDPRIERALAWLQNHQRSTGRWFTRSLWRDNKHFITHAGTAFAVMALAAWNTP